MNEITLDLFGFTKMVAINSEMFDRGEVDIILSYPLGELCQLKIGVEIKAVDMENSSMRFYQCGDWKWRPRKSL